MGGPTEQAFIGSDGTPIAGAKVNNYFNVTREGTAQVGPRTPDVAPEAGLNFSKGQEFSL